MEFLARLASVLKHPDTTVVLSIIYGALGSRAMVEEGLRRTFGRVAWPVTWVEGAACAGGALAGIQVLALEGGAVQKITQDGRVIGSVFEDGAARHCFLGGLGPGRTSLSPAGQTARTLERMQEGLEQGGFNYANVVRTWFFLDKILSWYSEFNRVRTEFYSRAQLQPGSLPASTGIGGRNPDGTALVAGLWAVQPLDASARIGRVVSPRQCSALDYGSAFSRAMEIASARGRSLVVSGTASIGADGRTMWTRDMGRQMELTLEVVESILRSRGAAWQDVTRATAYFRRGVDVEVFQRWLDAHGHGDLPVVMVQAEICRDDLLFELEADAWLPAVSTGGKAAEYLI
jgi:enamine deaminase RidA (YjgF/YER057c/UK114 family)